MSAQSPVPVLTTAQRAAVKAETTWGTPVTPDALLTSVSVTPKPTITTEKFTAMGYRLPFLQSLSEQAGQHSYDGKASYEDLPKFLQTISPASSATGEVVSYTMAAGFKIWPGTVVNSVSLKGDRNAVNLSGTLLSKWFSGDDNVTAGLIPGATDPTPIQQHECSISLGGATLSRWFTWSLDINNLVNLFRFGGQTTPGVATLPDVDASFSVEFEANSTNRAFMDDLSADLAVVLTMTDGGSNTITVTGAGRIGEIMDLKDNEGVYGYGLKITLMGNSGDGIVVA